MNAEELRKSADKYHWYHSFDLGEGVIAQGSPFEPIWNFILLNMRKVEFAGKSVIDIGCRDGKFSFNAENSGASHVLGIDNDLSRGAVEFLIPYFKSNVVMREQSIYDLNPVMHGQ